jgi:hypothetical protein
VNIAVWHCCNIEVSASWVCITKVGAVSISDHELLREIFTADELLHLISKCGFTLQIERIERFSGETVLCLGDDSDDGPLWHVFLGYDSDLFEGFDLVCYRPTTENPYRIANEWNQKHYKSVMTVMLDDEDNPLYIHPYFSLRICSSANFQQLLTFEGFERHLSEWVDTVIRAIELFPYEPDAVVNESN